MLATADISPYGAICLTVVPDPVAMHAITPFAQQCLELSFCHPELVSRLPNEFLFETLAAIRRLQPSQFADYRQREFLLRTQIANALPPLKIAESQFETHGPRRKRLATNRALPSQRPIVIV